MDSPINNTHWMYQQFTLQSEQSISDASLLFFGSSASSFHFIFHSHSNNLRNASWNHSPVIFHTELEQSMISQLPSDQDRPNDTREIHPMSEWMMQQTQNANWKTQITNRWTKKLTIWHQYAKWYAWHRNKIWTQRAYREWRWNAESVKGMTPKRRQQRRNDVWMQRAKKENDVKTQRTLQITSVWLEKTSVFNWPKNGRNWTPPSKIIIPTNRILF